MKVKELRIALSKYDEDEMVILTDGVGWSNIH